MPQGKGYPFQAGAGDPGTEPRAAPNLFPEFNKFGGSEWQGTYNLKGTSPLPLVLGSTYRQQIGLLKHPFAGMKKVFLKIPADDPKAGP